MPGPWAAPGGVPPAQALAPVQAGGAASARPDGAPVLSVEAGPGASRRVGEPHSLARRWVTRIGPSSGSLRCRGRACGSLRLGSPSRDPRCPRPRSPWAEAAGLCDRVLKVPWPGPGGREAHKCVFARLFACCCGSVRAECRLRRSRSRFPVAAKT